MRGLLAATLLLLAHQAQAQAPAPDPVVAQRGPVVLTASQVRSLVSNADPQLRQELQHDPASLATLVRDRLLQLVILAEAHDHQWDSRPDVIWRANQAHDAAIAQSYVASVTQPEATYPSEAEIQTAYDANKARLVVPRQYHLAQIFAAAPAGSPTAQGLAAQGLAAQKKLADLRAQVTRGHADFATLARRASDDHASAQKGGDLGWVREDQVLPAVRAAVAGLPEGGIAEPVQAGDGWHLVRLLATRAAAPATLAEVHDALARALRQRRAQQNAQAYVDALQRTQPIQLNEIELTDLAKP